MVSRLADHAKAPVATGIVEKADSTLRESIGWLNLITISTAGPMPAESCEGVMQVTTGSRGSICDWARNIFAAVPGTVMDGICGPALTVAVSFVSSKFTSRVPAG
jgi:hypothetical protein